MKNIYNKIKKVAKNDGATPERLLVKSMEELGELAEAVNWLNQYKHTNKTREEIIDACAEEGVDVMICIMAIFDKLNIDDAIIDNFFDEKLKKYKKKLKHRNR